MDIVFAALTMGFVATLTIDVWAEILSKGFKLPTTNWAMVGRWFAHLPKGQVIHKPIAASDKVKFEAAIGWVLHYVIGIVYAFIYLALLHAQPDLLSAIIFGLATVLVPWFVLQPGLGMGIFARFAPKPTMTRIINLSMHSIFGAALYLGWLMYASII
ncbi:MAG: DUF2938 domain-containing protein [Gammaproteobacteria bacterium]|nr:DUF2938 domain-containing protein [Gammaproteobacteria bacterium]MDH5730835.1 DUF2938 domain-containing protein [Gammaproteobacteria bacterium]